MPTKSWPGTMSMLIVAGAVGVTFALSSLSFFAHFELKRLDLSSSLRGSQPPLPQMVVVAIDELSFAEINQQWPWPSSLHAQTLKQLNKADATVIGFDILFTEPSTPDQDLAFARVLEEARNAVLASGLTAVDEPLVINYVIKKAPFALLLEVATEANGHGVQIQANSICDLWEIRFTDVLSHAGTAFNGHIQPIAS